MFSLESSIIDWLVILWTFANRILVLLPNLFTRLSEHYGIKIRAGKQEPKLALQCAQFHCAAMEPFGFECILGSAFHQTDHQDKKAYPDRQEDIASFNRASSGEQRYKDTYRRKARNAKS